MTIAMTQAEALERRVALTQAIVTFVSGKRELTDLVLDALLSAYLNVADETGRLPEVVLVMRKAADAIDGRQLVTTHH